MTEKDTGGSAFPSGRSETVGQVTVTSINGGMSLRDWFAGQALAGLTSQLEMMGRDAWELAEASYLAADAMLAEREK